MKVCPKCGIEYTDDANFCPIDAARLVDAGHGDKASARGKRVGDLNAVDLPEQHFELQARVGGRQTGEVYRGKFYSAAHRGGIESAIKLVDPAVLPKRASVQRAERELSKLQRLDVHPVAKIRGYGNDNKSGQDQLWIAMEWLPDRRTLHDIVFDDGPLPVKRAAQVAMDAGKGLAEAARIGVIHHDLAPKNLLLDSNDRLKIINFSVPVPVSEKTGGTPEFVSPEVIEGKPVDQRAMIYSLGALFYYMVAGRPPYLGDPEQVYEQHQRGLLEPPSVHADNLSTVVDAVILRAMARVSSRRFMTLRQFLADVERLATGDMPQSAGIMVMVGGHGASGKSRKLARTMLGGFGAASHITDRSGEGGADDGSLQESDDERAATENTSPGQVISLHNKKRLASRSGEINSERDAQAGGQDDDFDDGEPTLVRRDRDEALASEKHAEKGADAALASAAAESSDVATSSNTPEEASPAASLRESSRLSESSEATDAVDAVGNDSSADVDSEGISAATAESAAAEDAETGNAEASGSPSSTSQVSDVAETDVRAPSSQTGQTSQIASSDDADAATPETGTNEGADKSTANKNRKLKPRMSTPQPTPGDSLSIQERYQDQPIGNTAANHASSSRHLSANDRRSDAARSPAGTGLDKQAPATPEPAASGKGWLVLVLIVVILVAAGVLVFTLDLLPQ